MGEGESKKEVIMASTSLKPGDEVLVYAGEIIPSDGLICEGKAFVDESMMTGESNPVFKEKDHYEMMVDLLALTSGTIERQKGYLLLNILGEKCDKRREGKER